MTPEEDDGGNDDGVHTGALQLPVKLRADPLQGDLGPEQEGGSWGGEQLNFLPLRFA